MSEKIKISLILSFTTLVCLMSGPIYLSALPELSQVFEVSSSWVNFTMTIYFIGVVIGTIISGPLSERVGRKKTLIISLLLYSLSSLLCGLSESITWFFVGRLLQGIGSSGGPIISLALVADRFEGHDYHKIVSYVLIMGALSIGGAPIMGSLFLHFFEWRVIFYVLAVLGILAMGLILFIQEGKTSNPRGIKEILYEYHFFFKNNFFRYEWLMLGMLQGAFYSFVIISPYIFRLHYGWSIIDFVWVGLALTLGESIGLILDEEIIDKVTGQKILLLGLFLQGATFLTLLGVGLPPQGMWLLAILTIYTLGVNLTSSFLVISAIKLNPQFTGLASSLINLSKVGFISFVLVLVLFLPETIEVINYFVLIAFLTCLLGYFKVRQ